MLNGWRVAGAYAAAVISAVGTFPPAPASVRAARCFVGSVLAEWGLRAAYDAAEMLVSEVVTNAVLHARTSFTVTVTRSAEAVRVSVSDGSPAVPAQRMYGPDSTTGRGMRLVDTLALRWAVEPDGNGGKAVWFEVSSSGDAGQVFDSWEDGVDVEALLADLDDGADPPVARLLVAA